ncbi:MAG: DNA polymerase I [Pegethrix bostrychoides GSE-TBD4-15B]|jgi:DNA polymerase-1|uniref:DNA polymerase I n=1 Tax=Pegethrix bostrychoides GSE-TBD4-15B TaxID=2839662 RepID=A0A951U448_9CYAN|nr:DNA polymerase I [Pegethrix bostrychoides GSE-TBD4-15B]
MTAQPKLLLIDGHSLAFRSYFAHAKGRDGGLRTSTGIPTSVTYGFTKSLLDTLEAEKPEYVVIAFDMAEPTFRHEADDSYKAGRPEAPEDFYPDLQNLQELLEALNIPIVTAAGYEADDVIGTLARRGAAAGLRVKVLSGDRDLFQLIDPAEQTTVLYLSNSFGRGTPPPKEFGWQQVRDKMGVLPSQVVDFKALCGDPSDNIPGVKGIGEKTAVNLLSTYGSLEEVYTKLDEIKGAVQQKLESGRDEARRSQYMAQIHLDVPLDTTVENCKLKGFDNAKLVPLLEKFEFRSLLGRINQIQQALGGEVSPEIAAQLAEKMAEKAAAKAQPRRSADYDDDIWFFSAEETANSERLTAAAIQPQIIDTPAKLNKLVQHLLTCTAAETPVAWDTETTSVDPLQAELVGIGCCWGAELEALAYIPTGHRLGGNLDKATVLEALRPILEDAQYPKVLQNAKYDRLVLRHQGIALAGVVFDTMLASYVINPEQKHSLSELGLRYLELLSDSYSDLVPKGKSIADLEVAPVALYCGMDVHLTFRLVPILRAELAQFPDLLRLLLDIELPLEPVLAEMENHGIRIDQDYLANFSKTLEQDLLRIEQGAYESAGAQFSLGSPKQLSELLFEKLGLERKKSRRTKTGYSTDAATLEKLQGDHPVVDAIIEYRTLSKLKSTYVDALPALVLPQTGRVHTDFNQAVTSTGRLSSSNPNLQNIPIRTAFSRQIRAAFIPEPGWLMVAADYSQIELRILAHLSQEPILLETYREGRDIHTLTAQLLFEKDQVTSEERRLAKVINFGVIYGMGAQRFARESGFKLSDSKIFIERFNQKYSQVFEYLQQMQREAIAQGYVTTIKGRRRYFNFASDSLKQLRGHEPDSINLDKIKLRDQYDAQLLRASANAPIQGSSADIIKIAMVQIPEILKPYRANLLLQVHDELVFEVHPDDWLELQPLIKSTMESAVALSVPLVVEVRSGNNWMEAK